MKLALLAFSPFSRLACRTKDILYRSGVLKARKAPLPTVSVGNLSFGGTEKTPLAMELIAHLVQMGHRPAFVSRGYRGSWEQPGGILSDGTALLGTWEAGGDEPFMVARRFPKTGVFVGKNRLASCLKARKLGFTAVVLDDAFQHRRLARDLDIVLVSPAERRPLREGPSALARADIILVRTSGDTAAKERIRASFPRAAVFEYRVTPRVVIEAQTHHASPASSLKGQRVFAFCGIAGPQRFLSALLDLGAEVVGSLVFPDHYDYPPDSLKRIHDAYGGSQARFLVTTEKDILKLEPISTMGKGIVQLGFMGTYLEGVPLLFLRIGLDIEHGFYKRLEAAFPVTDAAPGGSA
jgi:tetraacyldisaccharide 4'-kinase